MEEITLIDKTFTPFISESEINVRVSEIADMINQNYKDKCPLLLCILNGAFIFAADLFKKITINSEITFVKLASYIGTESTDNVLTLIGLDKNLENRHVIIVEDIVDSGKTMHVLLVQLAQEKMASVAIASLLLKPKSLKYPLKVEYVGFEIDDNFVVGYGMDYNGLGRNIPYILQLESNNIT